MVAWCGDLCCVVVGVGRSDGTSSRIAVPNSQRLVIVEPELAERVEHDLCLRGSHVELVISSFVAPLPN